MAAALLAGCSRSIDTESSPSPINRNPQVPQAPPATATCDAAQAQFALGDRASDDLLERSRTAATASTARYLRPNQAVTLEFLGSRLNLKLDDKDVVVLVNCG